jgi:putative sigma-54 modulation protein
LQYNGFGGGEAHQSPRAAAVADGRAGRKEFNVIVTVSSRHMDVTPPMKTYAEQKASKLTKYYDRISEIEVIFDAGKEKTSREKVRVEMIVNVEHNDRFVAHCEEGDAYACVDACIDKLERQLSDHKDRLRNRKHVVGDTKRGIHTEPAGGSA